MQSKAKTVEEYLASLPEDRRAALQAIRRVILENLDKDLEEGMTYGMIGYYVPHRIFPAGYHCDPRQPLPYANLGSQKGHMSLHLMPCYGDSAQNEWLSKAWTKAGKKLDMGKACIRFKKLEDVPLEVVGEAFRRFTVKSYVATYTKALADRGTASKPKPTSGSTKKAGAKKAATPKKSKTRAAPVPKKGR